MSITSITYAIKLKKERKEVRGIMMASFVGRVIGLRFRGTIWYILRNTDVLRSFSPYPKCWGMIVEF